MKIKMGVLALMAVLCGAQAVSAREVNIFTSRHYGSDEDLYAAFTEQTGIEVNIIEGDADELLERIKSEGANSAADVFVAVDVARLYRAEQAGIFAPVNSTLLETRIPAEYQHEDNLWFGFTRRARVIYYNKATVDPSELSTYEALATPEWEGRVCVRTSSNVYNQSLLASVIANAGEDAALEWAQGISRALARPPEGGDTDQIRAVAAGQCDLAIGNHYYYLRLAASSEPADQAVVESVGMFFPNQDDRGTHVNISGAGMVSTAPNPENAQAYLEFLSSREVQTEFAAANNEFPVVPGTPLPERVETMAGDFKADTLNLTLLGVNNPAAVRIADEAQWP